jgi:hypothetical protein
MIYNISSKNRWLHLIFALLSSALFLSLLTCIDAFSTNSRRAARVQREIIHELPSFSFQTASTASATSLWATGINSNGVNGEQEVPATPSSSPTNTKNRIKKSRLLPKQAYYIYTEYARRLWTETNPDARKKVANDKIKGVIRNMQQIVGSDEYAKFSDGSLEAKNNLLFACDQMLSHLPNALPELTETKSEEPSKAVAVASTAENAVASSAENEVPQTKKKSRSVLFGVIMGAVVACWVFSGHYIFTGIFTLMTILGQLEYYRMVMNTGVYPARRISVVGACSMFLTVRPNKMSNVASTIREGNLSTTVSTHFLLFHRHCLHQNSIKYVSQYLDYGPWFGFLP